MTVLPLSRFTVLDLSRVRSGPTAVRFLADWGADVIQVEAPGDDEFGFGSRDSSDFQNLHRNKRSMTLNLKEPEGKAIFFKLVENADVVVENYRPDVKYRLGIDYDSLKKVNPRIVLGSISGFGQDGPYARRPGFDQIAQGMGGLMWITGLPGQGPVRAGTAIADIGAGIHCAIGILLALLERETSGEGQWVSTSLLQAMIAMCDFQAARWTVDHEVPPQSGNNHPTTTPTGVFRCRDGYVNIAATGDRMFRLLCEAIDQPALAEDKRFIDDASRNENREILNQQLGASLGDFKSAELIDKLNQSGVPCGPIYKMDEVFADPQVQHLEMAKTVKSELRGEMALISQAVNMSRTPFQMRTATPEKSEHTFQVLKDLGYNDADITEFRRRGIV